MPRCGYIYYLLNRSMPGLVKIGFTTTTLEKRMRQLSTSGVPEQFLLGAAFAVSDPSACERDVHEALAAYRANDGREFFRVGLTEALEKSLPLLRSRLIGESVPGASPAVEDSIHLTEGDVCLLQLILHDGQAKGRLTSTADIRKDHDYYSILELERVLLGLEHKGLIARVCKPTDVIGHWKMTPMGIRYMLDNGLAIRELLDEDREHRR